MSDKSEEQVISWTDLMATHSGEGEEGPVFNYNLTSHPRGKAKEMADARLETMRILEKAVMDAQSGKVPLFMRITTGQKAGSILRIKNPEVFQRHDVHHVNRRYSWFKGSAVAQRARIDHQGSHGAEYGTYALDGHFYLPIGDMILLEDDKSGKVVKIWRNHSSNKTMKPQLVLGYQGSTQLVHGKPVRSSPTLIDRFGQEVGLGDVVLLGLAGNGTLLTGKITKISDSFGVWLKHIGSKDDHYEKACQGNQLLKLKDLEKVLMLEKLKSL